MIANRCDPPWVFHFRSLFCRSGRRPYLVLSADRPAPCKSQDAQKLVALSLRFTRAFGGAGAAGSSATDILTLPAPESNKGTQVCAAAFQRCDAHSAHSLTLAQRVCKYNIAYSAGLATCGARTATAMVDSNALAWSSNCALKMMSHDDRLYHQALLSAGQSKFP